MAVGWLSRLLGTPPEEIKGEKIVLRQPRSDDYEQWRDLRAQSQAFLVPWEPRWSEDELSSFAYRSRLRAQRHAIANGTAAPYFIFAADGKELLGGVNITNIRRGVAQSGTLGYWMAQRHARHGHMTRALAAVMDHACKNLKLHRLEAACLPANVPSVKLLTRAQFKREGLATSYLKINGTWEDHLLWGRVLSPTH